MKSYAALLFGFISMINANTDHEIKQLPNQKFERLPFRHFAAKIPLSTGEKMFYWYAESSNEPDQDPIVLWLNGGPGCSSLGGFFTENGPFVVLSDLTVDLNPYRWNRRANIVWLESPAGVGFSSPESDFHPYYNDETTTERSYEFLKHFFDRYPSLQGRDFYIAGESYAGIYIPALVNKLVENPLPGIQLKGFTIGNPFTDAEIDGNAYMDYFYSHAMISLENYDRMVKFCASEIGQCMYTSKNCSKECSESVQEGLLDSDTDQLNPYYIYGDKCMLKNSQAGMLRYTTKKNPVSPEFRQRSEIGPCTDKFTQTYLNLPSVQNAIHVAEEGVSWTDCNNRIAQVYNRTKSALPLYRNILNRGLRVLIYSGDADSVVNFMGTERWISRDGLKLSRKGKWSAWFGPDKQLAGYLQEYDGLTFKTVKGSGHMVPATKPLHALNMFECFIYDNQCDFAYPTDAEEVSTGFPTLLDADRPVSDIVPLCLALLFIAAVIFFSRRIWQRRQGYNKLDQ